MSAPAKISDSTVAITGVIAWLILAFASVKLSIIYAPDPAVAYIVSYNVCAVIFLLYFIGYFKQRFTIGWLFALIACYNIGMNVLNFVYDRLFLIYQPPFELERMIASTVVNLVVMLIIWTVLFLLLKPRR
jgi:hypothetical protein